MALISKEHKILDLKSKLSYWHSAQGQAEFMNNVPYNRSYPPPFGTQIVSGGYYYLSDHLVGFYDTTTGSSIRIKRLVNGDVDYTCFVELQKVAQLKGNFRMDSITHREPIVIDAQEWEYAEIAAPNGEYGTNFSKWFFDTYPLSNGRFVDDSVTAETKLLCKNKFKKYIDTIKTISTEMKSIAQEHNAGLPMHILNLPSIYEDSAGFFWSDIEQAVWAEPIENLEQNLIKMIRDTLQLPVNTKVLTFDEAQEIITYAENAWSIQ